MEIIISRKDITWSYLSQFFSVASGILTLPLILKLLTIEEIGLNYLMLTVGSLVALFDFGFTPQFSRNISYIFSGANKLEKDGLNLPVSIGNVNYKLLSNMIKTAQFLYRRLAVLVFLLMMSLGSWYIYSATNGFTSVENTFLIWLIYSISVFFNIYYSYYSALLTGKGQIMETRKANVYSKITYILLTFAFLYLGWGLIGVALANLIAPFVNRSLSYKYFFTEAIKKAINLFETTKKERKDLFDIIWYNSKKLGLVFIGSFAINKLSMFLAGIYLSLEDIASYGLMIQLCSIILTISTTLFGIYQPRFSALRIEDKQELLLKEFAFSQNIYYALYIIGGIFLVLLGPFFLELMGSNVHLPNNDILIIFLLIIFLEGNHSNFATFIVTKNNVPFVESSLISGAIIGAGCYVILSFTNLGILGLVLVQGFTQLLYSNWKWPYVVCQEFGVTFLSFLKIGLLTTIEHVKQIINE